MTFKKRKDITDQRAIFANDVCDLLFGQYKRKIYKSALPEVEKFYRHFENTMNNFYEVLDEVPLFYLYYFTTDDQQSFFGLSDDEFENEKLECRKACEEYYK